MTRPVGAAPCWWVTVSYHVHTRSWHLSSKPIPPPTKKWKTCRLVSSPRVQIPQCTSPISHDALICHSNVHISVTKWGIFDICLMFCLIWEMGLQSFHRFLLNTQVFQLPKSWWWLYQRDFLRLNQVKNTGSANMIRCECLSIAWHIHRKQIQIPEFPVWWPTR